MKHGIQFSAILLAVGLLVGCSANDGIPASSGGTVTQPKVFLSVANVPAYLQNNTTGAFQIQLNYATFLLAQKSQGTGDERTVTITDTVSPITGTNAECTQSLFGNSMTKTVKLGVEGGDTTVPIEAPSQVNCMHQLSFAISGNSQTPVVQKVEVVSYPLVTPHVVNSGAQAITGVEQGEKIGVKFTTSGNARTQTFMVSSNDPTLRYDDGKTQCTMHAGTDACTVSAQVPTSTQPGQYQFIITPGANNTVKLSNTTLPFSIYGNQWQTISAGISGSTCAISTTGKLYCWGHNHIGQLGNGVTNSGSDVPVPVSTGSEGFVNSGVLSTSVGYYFACALDAAGKAYCWGDNTFGQLGNATSGASSNTNTPVLVTSGSEGFVNTGIKSITVGALQVCAIDAAGKAFCWGGEFFR